MNMHVTIFNFNQFQLSSNALFVTLKAIANYFCLDPLFPLQSNILIHQVCMSVSLWRWASTGGLGTREVQVHPQQVQASNGWMVRRWVLNHFGPVWSDGNWCSGIQWMDGAPVGAESLWPNVIRWKPVFSNNWKNIKNRRFHFLVHWFFENREYEW